jgi:hypothetical protein
MFIFLAIFKDSLNKDELVNAFSIFFANFPDSELEKFFHKLDSEDKGLITWNEFCNHLLVYYREKDYSRSLKYLPFNTLPKLIHSTHNQVIILIELSLSTRNSINFYFNFQALCHC